MTSPPAAGVSAVAANAAPGNISPRNAALPGTTGTVAAVTQYGFFLVIPEDTPCAATPAASSSHQLCRTLTGEEEEGISQDSKEHVSAWFSFFIFSFSCCCFHQRLFSGNRGWVPRCVALHTTPVTERVTVLRACRRT